MSTIGRSGRKAPARRSFALEGRAARRVRIPAPAIAVALGLTFAGFYLGMSGAPQVAPAADNWPGASASP